MATINWNMYNVILLGFAFMALFTAFQTCAMVEKSVTDQTKKDTNGTFDGNGYVSLATIYGMFAVCNWIAPSLVAVAGAKISMLIGGIMYTLFIASFLKPMNWSFYTGSVLIGFGAAILWTGQGKFLTDNSNKQTMARNSGIFWAMLQCSLLIGNLYVYFSFHGETDINKDLRWKLFLVLTVAAGIGLLCIIVLRSKPPTNEPLSLNESEKTEQAPVVKDAFVSSVKLFITRDMLLLSVCFFYTGLELTFFSGVYGTSIGNTKSLDDPEAYLGVCGILIGIGEISSGVLFGLLGSKTNKYGRDLIVLLGFLLHTVAFFLIFLNVPDKAPSGATHDSAYIDPNKYLAFVCAFLLGFGDGSFNTQITSILGVVYSEDPAPAFALFKFSQSVAAAIGFFYSTEITLRWQLLILQVFAIVGTYCFCVVEWEASRRFKYERVNTNASDTEEATPKIGDM